MNVPLVSVQSFQIHSPLLLVKRKHTMAAKAPADSGNHTANKPRLKQYTLTPIQATVLACGSSLKCKLSGDHCFWAQQGPAPPVDARVCKIRPRWPLLLLLVHTSALKLTAGAVGRSKRFMLSHLGAQSCEQVAALSQSLLSRLGAVCT